MSWLILTLIILNFTFSNLSEARQGKKHPSAVVVGTVYCDTCFQEDFSKSSHFISGALVAVECGDTSSKPSFRKEVKTNEHGEFKVPLPFSVSKDIKKIKGCSLKLIRSSEPYCAVASSATSSSLHLKSRKPGTHIFSAGFFTFKPLKQPELCSQKQNIQKSMKPLIPNPKIQDPEMPILPPIGKKFLPPLPNFPPTNSLKTSQLSNEKTFQISFPPLFPSNPFQPPPSIRPPIFPSPPPAIFPPILPTIPGLFPSPPPPPPAFPFPFPPFPFQPSPGFPGIPPAASSPRKTIP